MSECRRWLVLGMAALFMMESTLAIAGSAARVIPAGKVRVLSEGKEVSQFKSEMPLPQGSMMACDGKCLVQMPGLQLVAKDQAVFALNESPKKWDLAVKAGEIDFAIAPGCKKVGFYTAQDSIQVEEAIIPAGTQSVVRGTIAVTDTQTQLTVHEGTLRVAGQDGEQLIQSGQSIKLAQAQMTPPPPPAGDPIQKTSTSASSGGGPGMSTKTKIGIGAGAAAVGLGLGLGLTIGLDDDDHQKARRREVSAF